MSFGGSILRWGRYCHWRALVECRRYWHCWALIDDNVVWWGRGGWSGWSRLLFSSGFLYSCEVGVLLCFPFRIPPLVLWPLCRTCRPIDRERVSSPSILRDIVISFLGRSGVCRGFVQFPTLPPLRSVPVAVPESLFRVRRSPYMA